MAVLFDPDPDTGGVLYDADEGKVLVQPFTVKIDVPLNLAENRDIYSWCLDCGDVWYQFSSCILGTNRPAKVGANLWKAPLNVGTGCDLADPGGSLAFQVSGASGESGHDCTNDYTFFGGSIDGIRYNLHVGKIGDTWYVLVTVDPAEWNAATIWNPDDSRFCATAPPVPIAFYGTTTDISGPITTIAQNTDSGGLTLDDAFITLVFGGPLVGTGVGQYYDLYNPTPATAMIIP